MYNQFCFVSHELQYPFFFYPPPGICILHIPLNSVSYELGCIPLHWKRNCSLLKHDISFSDSSTDYIITDLENCVPRNPVFSWNGNLNPCLRIITYRTVYHYYNPWPSSTWFDGFLIIWKRKIYYLLKNQINLFFRARVLLFIWLDSTFREFILAQHKWQRKKVAAYNYLPRLLSQQCCVVG